MIEINALFKMWNEARVLNVSPRSLHSVNLITILVSPNQFQTILKFLSGGSGLEKQQSVLNSYCRGLEAAERMYRDYPKRQNLCADIPQLVILMANGK